MKELVQEYLMSLVDIQLETFYFRGGIERDFRERFDIDDKEFIPEDIIKILEQAPENYMKN